MTQELQNRVGIWIDLERALFVRRKGHQTELQTLHSGIRSRKRIQGERSARKKRGFSAFDYESHQQRHLNGERKKYYDSVVRNLGQPSEVYLFGPSRSKTDLVKILEKELPSVRIAAVETCDRMTDQQFAALVRDRLK